MRLELTLQMVRALKGAPLSVLVALMISGRSETASWCERHSGYNDNETVQNALLLLSDYGLVARQGRFAWQVTTKARQLPLMQMIDSGEDEPEELPEGDVVDVEMPARDYGKTAVPEGENGGTAEKSQSDYGKTAVPRPSTTSSSLTSFKTREELTTRAEECGKTAVMAALIEAGIEEPKRSRLAALPHVTAELVRGHVATCRELRLAIWRIERGWKVPGAGKEAAPLEGYQPELEPEEPELEPEDDDAAVFAAALALARERIPRAAFDTWCQGLRLAGVRGGRWLVAAGNPFAVEHIRATALDQLEACLTAAAGGEAEIVLGVADALRKSLADV